MPIASEVESRRAAEAAEIEALVWMEVAAAFPPAGEEELWADLAPSEAAVVGFFDPREDLERRARAWGHRLPRGDLADVARFAAGLAQAEADAWRDGRRQVATRAYAERRYLLGDRILHWAVPWLDAVARCYPELGSRAGATRDRLLRIGDRHRPAPALAGSEGLVVPGFDGYGPLQVAASRHQLLLSLWSGTVLLGRYLREVSGGVVAGRDRTRGWMDTTSGRRALQGAFTAAARRWESYVDAHPGSSQLWRDLAHRAQRTARLLQQSKY